MNNWCMYTIILHELGFASGNEMLYDGIVGERDVALEHLMPCTAI